MQRLILFSPLNSPFIFRVYTQPLDLKFLLYTVLYTINIFFGKYGGLHIGLANDWCKPIFLGEFGEVTYATHVAF